MAPDLDFSAETPEIALWFGGDRLSPPDEAASPAGNAVPVAEKLKRTVDIRDCLAAVTWENGGAYLTFRISTGGADLTFLAGPPVLRQLKQMLSWADDHPAPGPGLPPATYLA